jgi:hypothetical protein
MHKSQLILSKQVLGTKSQVTIIRDDILMVLIKVKKGQGYP